MVISFVFGVNVLDIIKVVKVWVEELCLNLLDIVKVVYLVDSFFFIEFFIELVVYMFIEVVVLVFLVMLLFF